MLLRQGPETSAYLVVLAPGDKGRTTDTAPSLIADRLVSHGIAVVRFACPNPDPTPDASLAALIRQVAAVRHPHQRLVLAGLSRGARVSASLVDDLGAVGLVGFAYPFHARRDPDPGDRVDQLRRLTVPTLLCQGTRDALGNQQQVRGYRLPPHIRLHWLIDANHALHPRARSGFTQADQLTEAADLAAAFILELG